MPTPTDIHLYTAQTPNGIKVSILLEELDLEYKTTTIEFSKNDQKVSCQPNRLIYIESAKHARTGQAY